MQRNVCCLGHTIQLCMQAVADNLRIDFVCLHWYAAPKTSLTDGEEAAAELAQYVVDAHNMYGKPIWLTEFALIDYNHPEGQEKCGHTLLSGTLNHLFASRPRRDNHYCCSNSQLT